MQVNRPQLETNSGSSTRTWQVDRNNRTIRLDNGYILTFENKDQAWHIKDARGNDVRIWGDPHVHEDDGGKWDFKDQMTFRLADGTKITVKTKPVGNGSRTVSDELFITKGDQAIHVTGVAENRVNISNVTLTGRDMDNMVADGYLAQEMGGVDDWSLNGREITRDLPNNYDIRLQHLVDFITPPSRDTLPTNFGTRPGESISAKFNELEADMVSRLNNYRSARSRPEFRNNRRFFDDLTNATQEDLNELRNKRNDGTRQDQIKLYNRLIIERHLQIKHNINLTHQGTTWSTADLNALDEQLSLLPVQFTILDDKLRTIRMEAMRPGVGGYNTGNGLIALPPGGIQWALIHEIGHDFDDENPRWGEFQAVSGWRNVTGNFRSASGDYQGGVYRPYDGYATLRRDGRVYHDGDRVDLDGDGDMDGIVQVHYGRVMVHNEGSGFLSQYASTNPKDDFAEAFKYFFTNPRRVLNESPEKYQFMVEYAGYDPLNR